MLLSLLQRVTLDPSLYIGTLAIRLDTDNRPECGVVSGSWAGFRTEAESHQPMPRFGIEGEDPSSFFDFVIDRPERRAAAHECLMYHYLATQWVHGGYGCDHAESTIISLIELREGFHLSFRDITVILPDYEPGWVARTGARAL